MNPRFVLRLRSTGTVRNARSTDPHLALRCYPVPTSVPRHITVRCTAFLENLLVTFNEFRLKVKRRGGMRLRSAALHLSPDREARTGYENPCTIYL